MPKQSILVLGGGFAGLWSAVGAARHRDILGLGSDAVPITLVNRDGFHSIRVRNYESDLNGIRVPLADILEPIDVAWITGEVETIDCVNQTVQVQSGGSRNTLSFDRLVFALGSQLARPPLPGVAQHTFDVDTYVGANKLANHLAALPQLEPFPGQYTIVVVGAGLTGIEAAAELPGRLQTILRRQNSNPPFRVILMDRSLQIGSDMGDFARPVIVEALASLGVEHRLGIEIVSIDARGITLNGGERIPTATVVWCAGMQANPLTRQITHSLDRMGRIEVDPYLRSNGISNLFVAGDAAKIVLEGQHEAPMSCQFSRPMGRFAGYNVVADLMGLPLLPLEINWYVTVLDLGPVGALYTEGWDRRIVAQGLEAKKTKQIINQQRIYPPLNRNRNAILAAAAPIVQRPPSYQK